MLTLDPPWAHSFSQPRIHYEQTCKHWIVSRKSKTYATIFIIKIACHHFLGHIHTIIQYQIIFYLLLRNAEQFKMTMLGCISIQRACLPCLSTNLIILFRIICQLNGLSLVPTTIDCVCWPSMLGPDHRWSSPKAGVCSFETFVGWKDFQWKTSANKQNRRKNVLHELSFQRECRENVAWVRSLFLKVQSCHDFFKIWFVKIYLTLFM